MSESPITPAGHPGVTPDQFDLIFPFHLVLGLDLRIQHRAPSLARVCPDATPGTLFKDHFELNRPDADCSFERLRELAASVTLWRHRGSGLKFRGQFPSTADQRNLLVVWPPWLADNEELARHGLMIEDFALHDPVVDMLQAQKIAFWDV